MPLKVLIKKALKYHPRVKGWKEFRDDLFLISQYFRGDLDLFFNYVNNIDSTKENTIYYGDSNINIRISGSTT